MYAGGRPLILWSHPHRPMGKISDLFSALPNHTAKPLLNSQCRFPMANSQCDIAWAAWELLAEQFILPSASSIDSRRLGQFDISLLDPTSFSRHKQRFAEIKAYTTAICKEDPTIEADFEEATCRKFGVERTAALQALRTKLGGDSHRVQQLGDLMILFMITKTSTTSSSHIKESAIDACRDFIITGHSEPKAFMERCRDGVSSLPLETSTEERRKRI